MRRVGLFQRGPKFGGLRIGERDDGVQPSLRHRAGRRKTTRCRAAARRGAVRAREYGTTVGARAGGSEVFKKSRQGRNGMSLKTIPGSADSSRGFHVSNRKGVGPNMAARRANAIKGPGWSSGKHAGWNDASFLTPKASPGAASSRARPGGRTAASAKADFHRREQAISLSLGRRRAAEQFAKRMPLGRWRLAEKCRAEPRCGRPAARAARHPGTGGERRARSRRRLPNRVVTQAASAGSRRDVGRV